MPDQTDIQSEECILKSFVSYPDGYSFDIKEAKRKRPKIIHIINTKKFLLSMCNRNLTPGRMNWDWIPLYKPTCKQCLLAREKITKGIEND